MASRRLFRLGLSVALLLSVPARADEPPDPPKVAAKPSAKGKPPLMSRPAVVGLLAALFLIVAGAAGANDKKTPA